MITSARWLPTIGPWRSLHSHMLLRAAQRFARAHRIPALVGIVELFIREEQRHAALLRAFMEKHHIVLKRTDWTDRVFRRVRQLAALELHLYVLISAEPIGIVYYRALAAGFGVRVFPRLISSVSVAVLGISSVALHSRK